jgi:ParB/RepB/Spo0J family partition protein
MQLSKVKIPKGRLRAVNPDAVETIAESMSRLGQLSPIVVLPDGTLIAGHHRVQAAKRLGWDEIDAVVRADDDEIVRLMEIDENLARNELSVLERAEFVARRRSILESNGDGEKFAENVAKATGRSKRSVEHDQRIGTLPDAIRDLIRGTSIADSTRGLLALARTDAAELTRIATLPEADAREAILAIVDEAEERHRNKSNGKRRNNPDNAPADGTEAPNEAPTKGRKGDGGGVDGGDLGGLGGGAGATLPSPPAGLITAAEWLQWGIDASAPPEARMICAEVGRWLEAVARAVGQLLIGTDEGDGAEVEAPEATDEGDGAEVEAPEGDGAEVEAPEGDGAEVEAHEAPEGDGITPPDAPRRRRVRRKTSQ